MSFVTQESLDNQVDLPVSAPTLLLEAANWLIIAAINLTDPIQLELRWLQLQIVEIINPLTNGSSVVVSPNAQGLCVFPPSDIILDNPDYGLAYLGLFRGFLPTVSPDTQALQEPPLIVGGINSLAPAIATRVTTPTVYATPGIYNFVLVNNTTNRNLKLAVTGQMRAVLNPSA